ncbi:MAG: SIS domain-containing protein [Chloroflexi bacterium]|nr:SIS domain-containing protein [Chloroflexota bacterium]
MNEIGVTSQIDQTIEGYLSEMRHNLVRLPVDDIRKMVEKLEEARAQGRQVFLFGNGGSASTASHLAVDLAKVTITPGRPRLKAIALTDNMAVISAWANDLAYDEVFSQQLQTHLQPGDVAIGISTSGRSPNVLNALRLARSMGATTIGLTGCDDGQMSGLVDLCIKVPDNRTGRIEDIHLMLGHIVTTCLTKKP